MTITSRMTPSVAAGTSAAKVRASPTSSFSVSMIAVIMPAFIRRLAGRDDP